MNIEITNLGKVPGAHVLPNPMVEGLVRATTNGFGKVIGDTKEHLHADALFVVEDKSLHPDNQERYQGFGGIQFGSLKDMLGKVFPDEEACYFSGAALDDGVQRRGLYAQMNDERLKFGLERGMVTFATRTQNGKVADGTLHAFDRAVERGDIAGFTVEAVSIPEAYGGMLTGEVPPRAEDPRIKDTFGSLNIKAGDAMVFIYRVAQKGPM